MELRFVPSESTFAYFETLKSYLQRHSRLVAFYSDKHSIFRVSREDAGGDGITQFGRALSELNIEILLSSSRRQLFHLLTINSSLPSAECRRIGIKQKERHGRSEQDCLECPPARLTAVCRRFRDE
jgi:hypothetical protein